MSQPKQKILFALYSWFYFKNLSSVVQALAEAGHEVTVATIRHDSDDFYAGVADLAGRYSNIRIATAPKRSDTWLYVSWDLRQAACYMHFLSRRFDRAAWLRKRPRRRAPEAAVALMALAPFKRSAWLCDLARRLTERLEKAVPPDPLVNRFLKDEAPDVMIVSPLIDLDARLWDCLKSGLALGIPSIYAVHSWDNLSSKSRLLYLPHRMLVWNQVQIDEAARYHGVPRDLVRATGAQVFDEWFERTPGSTRKAFCDGLGFDPAKPIILYVCSALNQELRPEPDYVRSWVAAVRGAADPKVRDANILIRPHPKRDDLWREVALAEHERVAIAPRLGEMPLLEDAKALFYDSFHHCSLVVGINTSALIEAGIVGRPVLTVLEPDYHQDQIENFHFSYLMEVSGGLLTVASSPAEHLSQLGACLEDPAGGEARAKAFVAAFVRPPEQREDGTSRFVEEVMAVAAEGARPPRKTGLLDRPIRALLWPWTISPEFVEAGVTDSTKQPKRERKHLRKTRWVRAATAWPRRGLGSIALLVKRGAGRLRMTRHQLSKRVGKTNKRLKKLTPAAIKRRVAGRF